jgi:hypothetical protein
MVWILGLWRADNVEKVGKALAVASYTVTVLSEGKVTFVALKILGEAVSYESSHVALLATGRSVSVLRKAIASTTNALLEFIMHLQKDDWSN